MCANERAEAALRVLERELGQDAGAAFDPVELVQSIRYVRTLLAGAADHWIDAPRATYLLGFRSDETIRVWVRLGLLRSHEVRDGAIQVLLDDVLCRREENEGLSAIGGEDLTPAELDGLGEWQGKLPWRQHRVDASR